MPSIIRVLTDQTINQIAAGEVIENPASVVKECVDNAIDAVSTEIVIEIKGGGRQLIRVTDNGCGMNRDDALLSLERHATSKIQSVDDISSIDSMGFRGEAVPSIASISKFTLLTCESPTESHPDPIGTLIIVDGGRLVKCCEAAHSPGTTIEVKNLFFNVPVRKKFQRSPTYDANEVQQMISQLALANPTISFKLISNQKTVLHAKSTNSDIPSDRIAEVLGRDFSSALRPLSHTTGSIKMTGFIGIPAFTRHNRTGQYLFINRRPVRSPMISFAIKDGYGTRLDTQRHPVWVLHLEVPTDMIDVNVHPQKKEIRFRRQGQLREQLVTIVDQALSTQSKPAPIATNSAPTVRPLPWMQQPSSQPVIPEVTTAPILPDPTPQPTLFSPTEPSSSPSIPLLGSFDRYLIFKEVDSETAKLLFIDRQAAERRIRYNQFICRLTQSDSHSFESQSLLVPLTLNLAPQEMHLLREHLDPLKKIGLALHEFGPTSFTVEAIPSNMEESLVRTFIDNVLDSLKHGSGNIKEQLNERLALAAMRASNRKNFLSRHQAEQLYTDLLRCPSFHECPLGHSTILNLAPKDIEKLMRSKAVPSPAY